MTKLRSIVARIAAMFRRRELDERIDDELRFHIEMQTEENIRRGMSPCEARRQARIDSGGVEQVKEMHRDVRGWPFLESLFQDVRFALRSFAKSPGFTATVLVTLALGIGVGTAVFSIVNAILLKPLPYRDPDRVMMLWAYSDDLGLDQVRKMGSAMGAAEFLDRKRHSRAFESMAAFRGWSELFGTENGEIYLSGLKVSEGFFEVLGVDPILGRRFIPEEYTADNDGVVILQYNTWRSRFGADPEIIGKQVSFGPTMHTIVGVMPPGFVLYSRGPEFLKPIDFTSWMNRPREYSFFNVIARLKEGVSVGQAQTEAEVLTNRMAQQYPGLRSYYEHRNHKVVPVSEDATGDLRPALAVLFGAVVVVMLIVCSNVANLMLGRASSRTREVAVRAAIGAGQLRLVRQLLTESLLLSLAGGAAGLGLAHLVVRHFQSMVPDSGWGDLLVQAEGIGIDTTTTVFAAAIAVTAGLIFGIAPAIHTSRSDLNTLLKDAATSSVGGRAGSTSRSAFVVVETALAVILVCCAGLLIRSFVGLYDEGPGFQTERRAWIHVYPRNVLDEEREKELDGSLSRKDFSRAIQVAKNAHSERILERLVAFPGVRDVAINSYPAMTSSYVSTDLWVYRDGGPPREPCEVMPRYVSPNYFALMGIPVLQGRGFGSQDRLDSSRVMIASRQAARTCWSGSEPLDSHVQLGGQPKGEKIRVVGLAGDVRDEGIDKDPLAVVYLPFVQDPKNAYALIVHADSDPAGLMPAMMQAIREVDSGVRDTWFLNNRTLEELVRDSAWKLNYSTMMLGSLAGLALLLAAIGVYGVLNETVRQRTREIGLRMAFGAEQSQVQRMILRQGLKPVVLGLVIGLLVAAGVTRFLGSLLFGVEPLDVPTFAGVVVVLLISALLAGYIPARRAASIDPMMALRHD